MKDNKEETKQPDLKTIHEQNDNDNHEELAALLFKTLRP